MDHDAAAGSGFVGSLKFVALLTLIALAVLAALVVLEVVAVPSFLDIGSKILLLGAIASVTVVLVWGLLRSGVQR